ncbi:Transcriptional regulator, GntR family [Microbacterium esteraromaticum]|uniref:Transcriptional regulator, GntR family n=1 Tax=Microbacterium esteraromaticum TaxID=57043 RepID=A0A1R4JWJ3_9MICO|nr:GntR family transcriptional regulator [Microbacterium esteraromaticum]SJN36342.1 Transcriptional regulator, GntR family [Microbacterium esteraromaticum]
MVFERVAELESERVANVLRDDIMLGHREPGSRLIERDIAAELNVSRLPVREAIKVLVSEGIVVARPRTWAVVREFSIRDLQDFAEVRQAMETLAFVLATKRLDDAGIERLEELVRAEDAAAAAGDAVGARIASSTFHMTAVMLAGNAMLTELAESLITRLRWLFGQHEELRVMAGEHREIVDAMKAGDVEKLQQLIPTHLARGHDAAERRLLARQKGAD